MIRPTKRQRVERPPSWLDCATLQVVPAAAAARRSTSSNIDSSQPAKSASDPPHSSDDGMIRTPLASATTRDIFLDRLRKEVVDKYGFSAASPRTTTPARGGSIFGSKQDAVDGNDNDPVQSQRRLQRLLRRRIAIGVNECTRALESAVGRQQRGCGSAWNHRIPEPTMAMNETAVTVNDGVESFEAPLLVVVAAEGMRPSPLPMVHIPLLAKELNVPLLLLPESSTRRELGRLLGIKSASILTFLSRPPVRPRSTHSSHLHDGGGHAGALSSSSSSRVSESTRPGATTKDDCAAGPSAPDDPDDDDIRAANAGLDSFIKFVCSKVVAAAPSAPPAASASAASAR
jgi:hypothetical protein